MNLQQATVAASRGQVLSKGIAGLRFTSGSFSLGNHVSLPAIYFFMHFFLARAAGLRWVDYRFCLEPTFTSGVGVISCLEEKPVDDGLIEL